MTEFESAVLTAINGLQEQMQEMKSEINGINTRLDKVDNRLDRMENDIINIKNDIEELKENTAITRTAANYNGGKIEELATELQKANIIA